MFDGTIISVQLQIILTFGCLFTYWYILKKVKKSNVRIDDIVFWIIGIITLYVFCLFPKIPATLASWIGFGSAVNSIFFIVIFFLFMMVFLQTIKISLLQEQVKDLAHQLALKDVQKRSGDKDR